MDERVPKPVPKPTFETQAFWDACNRGELLYQKCSACGHVQFYPRSLCAKCHDAGMTWERSQGRGTLHTFSIVHRPPTEAFKPDVPYVLALIDMAEGFRMMTNVVNCDPDSLDIGTPIRIVFERRGEQMIPQAEVADH